jgi:hypothetical protein
MRALCPPPVVLHLSSSHGLLLLTYIFLPTAAAQYGDILESEELNDILRASEELQLSSGGDEVSRGDFVLAMLVRMDKVRM